jgi:hypothetical protein
VHCVTVPVNEKRFALGQDPVYVWRYDQVPQHPRMVPQRSLPLQCYDLPTSFFSERLCGFVDDQLNGRLTADHCLQFLQDQLPLLGRHSFPGLNACNMTKFHLISVYKSHSTWIGAVEIVIGRGGPAWPPRSPNLNSLISTLKAAWCFCRNRKQDTTSYGISWKVLLSCGRITKAYRK